MPQTRVALLTSVRKIDIIDREIASLTTQEIRVRVLAAGIGGTDIRIFKGVLSPKLPVVLGQEFSGEVEEVGSGVKDLTKGDRVCVEPIIRDETCVYCRTGTYTLCDSLKVMGIHADGGFSERVNVPRYTVNKLSDRLSTQEGALITPVAVALYAVHRAQVGLNSTVVVIGGGPIGLSAVQLSKRAGASDVILVEPSDRRKRLGTKLGATVVQSPDGDDLQKKVAEVTSGKGADIVIEASGASGAPDQALRLVRKGGRVVIAGAFGKPETIDIASIVRKDLEFLGSWLYPHVYGTALEMVSGGVVKVADYIDAEVKLDEISQGFQQAESTEIVKVMVKP